MNFLFGKLSYTILAHLENCRHRNKEQSICVVTTCLNCSMFRAEKGCNLSSPPPPPPQQDLKEDTDIDLENIVYYKDDTHYFVMTAKKDSLLRKGVLLAVSHNKLGNWLVNGC